MAGWERLPAVHFFLGRRVQTFVIRLKRVGILGRASDVGLTYCHEIGPTDKEN